MALTNFPQGITSYGTPMIGGSLPIIPETGNYWFVDSVNGSSGNPGSFDSPFASLVTAISAAAANDIIVIAPAHAETIAAAAGIAVSKAGLQIFGVGSGNKRPTFTFATSTAATMTITAAGVSINNIIGTTSIDQLVSPFVVSAADVTLNLEWRDGSSSLECVRCILTTAAADKLKVNLKYIGLTAGTHCVNAVRLVGVDTATINIDFYGKASTSVVEFLTTACTNVEVYGYMYNSGTTDGSKDVVDTVTGSTWFASIYDGAAGSSFSGGSGAALATDDVSVVAANQAVSTADSTANTLSRDVVGNKTDASVYVPGTTKSLAAYSKGHADLQEKVALKAAAVMTNGLTLFTVTGGPIMVIGLTSICVTGNDGTASTLQYSVSPTSGSAQTISNASNALTSATAGASVTLAGTALATAALYNANGPNLIANPGTIMVPAGTITAVIGTGSTTGTWAHYLRYRPLAVGVSVA